MKVLLVEDHPQTRTLIAKFLEKNQFDVDQAMDGKEGLRKATSRSYDIIILDMMLPEKSGFEVIRELRSKNIQTPILGISALQLVEDRIKALDAGADDFLVKNFALPELLTRIKCLCRRRKNDSKQLLECDDLQLDFNDCHVERKGINLYLTQKEFDLLAELLRNKDKVLSHQQIWNNVWRDEEHGSSLTNTISVHIRFLRAKVDDPFDRPLIHTVRGHGYMLSAQKP